MYFCIQTFIIITNLECECERNANQKKNKTNIENPNKIIKTAAKIIAN